VGQRQCKYRAWFHRFILNNGFNKDIADIIKLNPTDWLHTRTQAPPFSLNQMRVAHKTFKGKGDSELIYLTYGKDY